MCLGLMRTSCYCSTIIASFHLASTSENATKNPHQTTKSDEGLSFRGRSKEFYKPGTMICIVHQVSAITPMISNPVILYSVSWSACEQHDQGEYGGEHYQLNAHKMPPRLPVKTITKSTNAVIHCCLVMAVCLSPCSLSARSLSRLKLHISRA